MVEMYIEDVERGIFNFPGATIYYHSKREEIIEGIRNGSIKGKVERLFNNICFIPDGYVMCGNVTVKARVYFLVNGALSQIILYHGKKNEKDDYNIKEKYLLSLQFLNELYKDKEKIFFWGSMRTYISKDKNAGEIFITMNKKGIDPYKA